MHGGERQPSTKLAEKKNEYKAKSKTMNNLTTLILNPSESILESRFNFSFHRISFIPRDSLLPLHLCIVYTPRRPRRRCIAPTRRHFPRRSLQRRRKILSPVDLITSSNAVAFTAHDFCPPVNDVEKGSGYATKEAERLGRVLSKSMSPVKADELTLKRNILNTFVASS
ncbi:hypothetical protein F2Q68_00023654 [Brassica cretica]|uniref:Endoplasmic reticulum resident protein 29 C-terminal domain-containing protein n=1 Tax=Brassica cretica TaxID=69181 RepID=A0A8S9IIM1_BRACR|nr:hypothetical protein F2Q68_00023654 [Brassica cretica]